MDYIVISHKPKILINKKTNAFVYPIHCSKDWDKNKLKNYKTL